MLTGRRRWVVLGTAVLVLGGGGGVAYALTRSPSSTAATATTTLVTVSTGTVQQTVATTGTINPAQDEDLSFDVSGTVTGVSATVGKKVAKGAVLATLDSTTLASAVTTATAAVTAAEQELSSVSGSSDTQVASAKAQLASAETDLANAKQDLAAASLTAPFAGTVAAVTLATGDVVGSSSPGASGSSTTGTVTLISTDAWTVSASVGSSDLAQLKKGLQAQITPSGASQLVFGTISSIGIVATSSTSGSATFPVEIAVTGSPTGLYAGGSATVSLIVKQLADALTVPTQAIKTVNGQTVVTKRVNGRSVSTPVTLGDSYGASTVVTTGLVSGDQVELTFTRPGGTGTTRRSTTTGGTGGGGFGGPPDGGFVVNGGATG
jgi:RND family efflux transporter MFP subunit